MKDDENGDDSPYIKIFETYVNETRGYQFGDSGWQETCYTPANKGRLFLDLQREYGRCISKMYVDSLKENRTKQVGWVFQKKMQYEDSDDWYLREVWVEYRLPVEKAERTETINV